VTRRRAESRSRPPEREVFHEGSLLSGLRVLFFGLTTIGCAGTLEEACSRLAEAECGHLAACSDALLVARYGDLPACEGEVAARCALLPGLPGATLGAGDIAACAAAYAHHPCASLLLDAPPEVCRFAGKISNGVACTAGAQCQSSSCKPSALSEDMECAAVRKEGDACSLGGSPCDAGLRCGSAGTCVPYGTVGEACSAAAPCNPLYWCDNGLCAPPAKAGESCAPCSGDATCNALLGLSCSAEGTCAPTDPAGLVAPGGACH
jgi:hypothetical protein